MDIGTNDWEVLKVIWGMVLSLLAWLGIVQIKRIDRLETTRVAKEEHEKELQRIQDDLRRATERVEESLSEHRNETQSAFARVFQRLDALADRISDHGNAAGGGK